MKRGARGSRMVLGLAFALIGWSFLSGGIQALQKWDAISAGFALCGVLWIAAGAAMMIGGFWSGLAGDASRMPRWIAAGATFVAGATAVIGTATYVIPCAGPS